jgi:hypothetical protein
LPPFSKTRLAQEAAENLFLRFDQLLATAQICPAEKSGCTGPMRKNMNPIIKRKVKLPVISNPADGCTVGIAQTLTSSSTVV